VCITLWVAQGAPGADAADQLVRCSDGPLHRVQCVMEIQQKKQQEISVKYSESAPMHDRLCMG
jgi:hypothetical protein